MGLPPLPLPHLLAALSFVCSCLLGNLCATPQAGWNCFACQRLQAVKAVAFSSFCSVAAESAESPGG